MSETKRKPGRPPAGDATASERIELRATPAQREAWQTAAAEDGVTLKAWIVAAIERAMKRRGKN